MDTTEDGEWFGEDMIQQNGDRITMPPEVVQAGVVVPGESVFWAEDDEGVVLSKQRAAFENADRFRALGETTLGEDRELMLPADVTTRPGFDAGDILHFVSAETFDSEHVCRLLTEDVSERMRS